MREALDQEPEPASLGLWLEVRGVQEGNFVYDLYFQATSDAADEDAVHADGDIQVVVPAGSVDRLRGARLEWSEDGDGGLVLVNPNQPTVEERSPGVPPEVLAAGITGPVAQRVVAVLEQAVNPSIASHGGRADLLGARRGAGFRLPPPLRRLPGLRHVADDVQAGDRDHVARRGSRADQGDRCHRSRRRGEPLLRLVARAEPRR